MEHRQSGLLEWEADAGHSMLGLQWHPRKDTFAYRVQPCDRKERVTKRSVLSDTARLYDPLGWLAPVVVQAKMTMQTLWQQRIEWDQPVSAEDDLAWRRFRGELPLLEKVRVPRWLGIGRAHQSAELHGFADASERAYAAVLYLRVVDDRGESRVSLLQAKTRVSPLRQVSLPRLELSAAALLVRLIERMQDSLDVPVTGVHLWSDSTVTLAWIRGHPSRWTTYVANRVAEIQRALPDALWHHVSGEENPADCASRGLLPSELLQHPLWWEGPGWLKTGNFQWTNTPEAIHDEDLPERRARVHAVTTPEDPDLLLRFSELRRLLRVTAWCRRWLRKQRNSATCAVSDALAPGELDEAERAWIVAVQTAWFTPELRAIERGELPSKHSRLSRLNPFLDSHGLLRVGGRLKHAVLSPDEKHPIILPRESRLTTLVVDACHRRTLHGGVQLTLGTLRQRFWVPGGRMAVRQLIHRCLPCVRWRAASPRPRMGDLPPPRVKVSRAFTHTGVDYAGPVWLRTSKGRGQKAYKGFLAIFVCLSTRAVHIEVASDYSTEAFLAAFRRFVSRRGLCSVMYSDRGTNFVGADAQLRGFFRDAARERAIADAIGAEGVQWRFNPPAAPHFGGIWEAAVKATKHHLRRVIGDSTLTFEELSTFLAQVEACLNSRPLLALSDDPEDLAALTPGHFLVGTALNAIPEPSLAAESTNRLSRWQLLQQMRDHFWHRWSREYLQALNVRSKWWKTEANLQVGDLCLVRGEQVPPTKWPLARIVDVHPGQDGQVRVVTVRTATTTLVRPACKIVPLLPSDATHGLK
ncbi:PREDICTED: uncharacterized protein LOC105460994 [Wasmannia auropunctata]|nr:PREDICTED: uncharacterized protein LOC105460994 [Wasmannia auropunctata]